MAVSIENLPKPGETATLDHNGREFEYEVLSISYEIKTSEGRTLTVKQEDLADITVAP